jgi:hypothetical protein
MSWPFGKPAVKHTIVPRVIQKDFEKEEKKIEQFECINKKFYKDVKRYIEAIDKVYNSELKLINNLINISSTTPSSSSSTSSSLSNQQTQSTLSDDFNLQLNQWKHTHIHENINSIEKLKTICQYDIIEPIKKLNTIFPNVHLAIKKREQAYNDLLKQQQKFEKLCEKERTGANLVKVEQFKPTLQMAKEIFQKEHVALMEQLPKLYDSRLNYIYPCIQQLVKAQIDFYEQITKIYASLSDSINSNQDSQSVTNNDGSQQHTPQQQHKNLSQSSSATSSTSSTSFLTSPNDTFRRSSFLPLYDHNIDVDIEKCLFDIKSLSIVSGD